MAKAAILIDGGYYLKRLPAVRRDVDPTDPEAVGASVRQLIRSHLEHLNEVHRVPNFYGLLYRAFYCDARPYDKKAHRPVSGRAIDYATTDQALFRKRLNPAHPGECLRESVRAMGWTITEAARQLGLSRVMTSRLLNGQARLTAATALAIERLDWGDAEYWMRLQASYDLAQERRKQAA